MANAKRRLKKIATTSCVINTGLVGSTSLSQFTNKLITAAIPTIVTNILDFATEKIPVSKIIEYVILIEISLPPEGVKDGTKTKMNNKSNNSVIERLLSSFQKRVSFKKNCFIML